MATKLGRDEGMVRLRRRGGHNLASAVGLLQGVAPREIVRCDPPPIGRPTPALPSDSRCCGPAESSARNGPDWARGQVCSMALARNNDRLGSGLDLPAGATIRGPAILEPGPPTRTTLRHRAGPGLVGTTLALGHLLVEDSADYDSTHTTSATAHRIVPTVGPSPPPPPPPHGARPD